MTTIHTHTPDPHDSAYDGLLVNDANWAFGTDFEDPLAGVDTTVPPGIDSQTLATYCLMLGDDALVLAHRLSEWSSRAPDLEEDIAITNIALDLLGQSRLLLARAAAASSIVVPQLPEGSPVPPEDALAFFRDADAFRNVRLAEVPNGDFAELIVRLLMFSIWRLETFVRLRSSADPVLAAVAAKGVKEVTYHRDFAARWFVILAKGTEESARRLNDARIRLMPFWPELFRTNAIEQELVAGSVAVDSVKVATEANGVLDKILALGGISRPPVAALAGVQGRQGRDGLHTEALSHLLGEMQVVARAHPMGVW